MGVYKDLLKISFFGAPGGIRTPNLMIRSHVLYPVELRVLKEMLMVPLARLELASPCGQQILSLSCLPFHHRGKLR